MGNLQTRLRGDSTRNATNKQQDEYLDSIIVDGGKVVPFGLLYPNAPQDYNKTAVCEAIQRNKLSPFYRGLDDSGDEVPVDWISDRNVTHFLFNSSGSSSVVNGTSSSSKDDGKTIVKSLSALHVNPVTRRRINSVNATNEDAKQKLVEYIKGLYRETAECPICFLNYPTLNSTRCCDHPICTDCFIQIKRPEPSFDPACCPYCVMPDLGVVLRKGNDVVLSDEIRPDWRKKKQEAEIERQINEARQIGANRLRPIFRQEDIASAATAAAELFEDLTRIENATNSQDRGNARRATRDHHRRMVNSNMVYQTAVMNMGVNIEELMMMEAIRQSMLETGSQPVNDASTSQEH